MKTSQVAMISLKLLITSVLLWSVFSKIDIGPLGLRFGSLNFVWIGIALVILSAQLLLTGVRWYFVGQMLGAYTQLGLSVRLILIGQFFNQVLPSSVGGDGVRAWLLSRKKISISRALSSVLCDRVAALVVLTVVVTCIMPIVMAIGNATIPSAKLISAFIAALTFGGLLILFMWGGVFSTWLLQLQWGRPFGVMIRDIRCVLFSSIQSLWVIVLSVTVQVMLVMCNYFCALSLGIEFSIVHLLMLPLIMLLSSIPISFAGWGLRESFMVAGLGFVGISADDALAVSISFGISQMVIGLPGFVIAVISIYKHNSMNN